MSGSAPLILAQTASASDNDMAVGLVVIGVIAALAYFLPTFIAGMRNHTSTLAIFVVNLVFGVSGIGWIVALIWALADNGRNRSAVVYQVNHQTPSTPMAFVVPQAPVQSGYLPTPQPQPQPQPQQYAPSASFPTVGGNIGACPNCASTISARAIFCPYCNSSLATGSVRPFNP